MYLQNKPWLISNRVSTFYSFFLFFLNSQSLDINTKNSFSNKVWSQGGLRAIKVMDFKWGSYKYKSLLHSFLSTLPSSSSSFPLAHRNVRWSPTAPPPFLKSLGTQKLTFPSALSFFFQPFSPLKNQYNIFPTHTHPTGSLKLYSHIEESECFKLWMPFGSQQDSRLNLLISLATT